MHQGNLLPNNGSGNNNEEQTHPTAQPVMEEEQQEIIYNQTVNERQQVKVHTSPSHFNMNRIGQQENDRRPSQIGGPAVVVAEASDPDDNQAKNAPENKTYTFEFGSSEVFDEEPLLGKEKDNTPGELALVIQGVYKKYHRWSTVSSGYVLNGFDLKKCYLNQIYVLYGAMKSGKSTLLKIVLNLCKLDEGHIYFYGKGIDDPLDVLIGYMPQQLGLEEMLTVYETIMYFATINGLEHRQSVDYSIKIKKELSMFDLSVKVGFLQEHQKRVLSFYIACMMEPDILLLDEPTTGCDPVYKHFIWHSIRRMVHDNEVTVLLTTSDPSECRNGDIMGYLRHGRLIIEDSPSVLLQLYNVSTISKLLYCVSIADHHISTRDKRASKSHESLCSIISGGFTLTTHEAPFAALKEVKSQTSYQPNIVIENNGVGQCLRCQCRWCQPQRQIARSRQRSKCVQLWTIFQWVTLTILRSYMIQLAYLLLPIVLISFYYYSVKDFVQIDLGVVTKNMNSDRSCDINNSMSIGCRLDMLTRSYHTNLHFFESSEEAQKYAKQHDLDGIIHMGSVNVRSANVIPRINLEIMETSQMVSTYMQQHLYNVLGPAINQDETLRSVNFQNPLINVRNSAGKHQRTHPEGDYLIWNAVPTFAHFVGLMMGSLPLMRFRNLGTRDRILRLGITSAEILIVNFTLQLIVSFVQNIFLLATVLLLIQTVYQRAWYFWCSLAVIMLQTMCGFSFGVFMQTFFEKSIYLLMSALVFELLTCAVAGFFLNPSTVGYVFHLLQYIVPHSHSTTALKAFIFKDSEIGSYEIWPAFVVPVAWTLIFYFLYWSVLRCRL